VEGTLLEKEIYNEGNTKAEFIKRLFASFLDIIVIAHFQQEPFSGYDVVQFAHTKFDILLSPGTVYSTLYSMEREKLLVSFNEPYKKIFRTTEKGMHMVKVAMSTEELGAFFVKVMKK
jgi:DNA-binding PadR family transcriptional regulator